MRTGGKILATILHQMAATVRPGINTAELNTLAADLMKKNGVTSSFLNYGSKQNPFPAVLCTSINQTVVHGIPTTKTILQEGDIVGLDIG
ncbi:MAG: M24 family metallopeptidase, partial [Patescibacteria group bacterium]